MNLHPRKEEWEQIAEDLCDAYGELILQHHKYREAQRNLDFDAMNKIENDLTAAISMVGCTAETAVRYMIVREGRTSKGARN